jgi:hypothetical protein
MPRWPAVTCSKALTLGRAVIRISARSAMSRGEAEAHELEPVTRQVSHHHRAHDADADAVRHVLLKKLKRVNWFTDNYRQIGYRY